MTINRGVDASSAYMFRARSCNSTSLNLFRTVNGEAITDYIQVLDCSGCCMMWADYKSKSGSNVTFTLCVRALSTAAQLFPAQEFPDSQAADADIELVTRASFSFVLDSGIVKIVDADDAGYKGQFASVNYLATQKK